MDDLPPQTSAHRCVAFAAPTPSTPKAHTKAPRASHQYASELVVPEEPDEEASSTDVGDEEDAAPVAPSATPLGLLAELAIVVAVEPATVVADVDPTAVVADVDPALPVDLDVALPGAAVVAVFEADPAGAAVAVLPAVGVVPDGAGLVVAITGAGPPVPQLLAAGAPGMPWMALTDRAVTCAERGAYKSLAAEL